MPCIYMCVVIPYNLIELETELIVSYIELFHSFYVCRLYSIKVLGLFDATKKKIAKKKYICYVACFVHVTF